VVVVHASSDPRLWAYRSVGDPELARRSGLFVAEGRFVVERLLDLGRFQIESLLLTPASLTALGKKVTEIDPAIPVFVSDHQHFAQITGFNLHRGCLALAHRPVERSVEEMASSASMIVMLEALTDADNVGGIFRNAAAFGVDAVILGPTTCDPLYRKAIRTSMAATLAIPFARSSSMTDAMAFLRLMGFKLVALSPNGDTTLEEACQSKLGDGRRALILGTEGAGLSHQAQERADVRVRIPIGPGVDSLNVAVAAGIALSRLGRF
jgi:tRNA G18 (ribose-2'-O)-methylase SpoU